MNKIIGALAAIVIGAVPLAVSAQDKGGPDCGSRGCKETQGPPPGCDLRAWKKLPYCEGFPRKPAQAAENQKVTKPKAASTNTGKPVAR